MIRWGTVIGAVLISCLFWGCAERNQPVGPAGNILRFISQTPTQGATKDVAVLGGLAYVADEPFGISVYDVSNPASPELVNTLPLQGGTTKARVIAVDSTGRIACVESDNGLQFFDLSNGNYLQWDGSGGHIKVELFYANDELRVFRCDHDNTDGFNYEIFPNTGTEDSLWFSYFQAPSFYSNYQEPYSLYGFALGDNNVAFVCRNNAGFAAIDYSAPVSAVKIGELNTPGKVRGAALSGNILCLAAGYEGLITVDVSDPTNPQMLGSLRITNATDIKWVAVSGQRVFLLDDYDGAFAMDISNPSQPMLIGELVTSDPNNFCVVDDYIYVADEDMGLVIGEILP